MLLLRLYIQFGFETEPQQQQMPSSILYTLHMSPENVVLQPFVLQF